MGELQQAKQLTGSLAQKLKEQRLKDVAREVLTLSA